MLFTPLKRIRPLIGMGIHYFRFLFEAYIFLQRIYLLKFAKSDDRQQLIVDSGFRCHLTDFARTKAASPSIFVTRLRKYLRTRRVTSVSQVGTDRIIEIQFSDGQYKLFLEFYAGGNIVLTDSDLTILSLFRIVIEGPNQEELRTGLTYSLRDRQNYDGIPLLTKERVRNGLRDILDGSKDGPTAFVKKPKKNPGVTLRKTLVASLNEFPPTLIDHALRVTAFDSNTSVEEVLRDDSLLDRLMLALGEAQSVISDIAKSEGPKGYIIASPQATKCLKSRMGGNVDNASENVENRKFIYEDFHPFRPQQFLDDPGIKIIEFCSFNQAVDEFFSSVEAQKLESRLSEHEENARKKLGAARQDYEKRLSGLKQVQESHVRKAQAIETNLQQVQEAMAVINGLLSQGMDWVEIARLVEMEQTRHNAVAKVIQLPLKLFENSVTLLLAEATFDDTGDFEGDETGSDLSDYQNTNDQQSKTSTTSKAFEGRIAVDIDLALSPWSNARQYYDQKKSAATKEQKTLLSSAKAIKSTETKVNADLKKGLQQEKQVLRPLRKPLWFEKFYFFISSENFLVLAGKDAQQNELLYQKYLKKGDIYVHADLNGAMPVIIKNSHENPEDPVPPSTLSQAGTLVVATSAAWDSKAIMSAWWVKAEQVSKFTTAGDLLNLGEFFIRDSKNFLPPTQLLLGFGLLFRVSEESKVRHLKHRFPGDAIPKCENFGKKIDESPDVQVGSSVNLQNEIQSQENLSGNHTDLAGRYKNDSAGLSVSPTYSAFGKGDHEWDWEGYKSLQLNATHCTNQDSESRADASTGSQIENASELPISQNSEDELCGTIQEMYHEIGEDELLEATHDNNPKGDRDELLKYTQENDWKRDDEKGVDLRFSNFGNNHSTSHHDDSRHSHQEIDPDQATRITNPLPASSSPSASSNSGATKQAPFIRGKKGKDRKIKDKYANQDDEDRALALNLLGSTNVRKKVEEDLAVKHTQDQYLAAQKQKKKEQHALAVEKGKEAEKIRKLHFEKGNGIFEDRVEEHVDLKTFLGAPLAGDEILDVLAICGPWDAVGSRCRWRAKLQPGTTKKGKAVKEILGRWTAAMTENGKKRPNTTDEHQAAADEDITGRTEEELLKGIKEHEVVGLLPVGKCRVIMGPGNANGTKPKGNGALGKGHRGGRGGKKPR